MKRVREDLEKLAFWCFLVIFFAVCCGCLKGKNSQQLAGCGPQIPSMVGGHRTGYSSRRYVKTLRCIPAPLAVQIDWFIFGICPATLLRNPLLVQRGDTQVIYSLWALYVYM